MKQQEYVLQELYLGKFMVQQGYISYEEYKANLVDYNLLVIEYAIKLGHDSFKQSVIYYVSQIRERNIPVRNRVVYLERCLDKTLKRREAGYY